MEGRREEEGGRGMTEVFVHRDVLYARCSHRGVVDWLDIMTYHPSSLPSPSQTYTADPQLEWTDVREWVVDTYPWQPSMNVNKLRTLNPEDVGWNHGECERVEGGRVGGW